MSDFQMWPPIAPNMPESIRAVFKICHGEHSGLRRKAKMCRDLWTDKETIALLNRTAPWFFHDVRWALFDDMHMAISRLTDPPITGNQRVKNPKANLVLEHLIDIIETDQPQSPTLVAELRAHLESARDKAKPIRAKRDTMIAHNDLPILTGGQKVFLRAGLDTLDVIFENFDAILSKIQVCYGGLPIPPDFLEVGHDAGRLVASFKKGEQAVKAIAGESERI